eukprot:gene27441-31589_t
MVKVHPSGESSDSLEPIRGSADDPTGPNSDGPVGVTSLSSTGVGSSSSSDVEAVFKGLSPGAGTLVISNLRNQPAF